MFTNDKTFQCSSLGKRREEGRVRKRSKSEHEGGRKERRKKGSRDTERWGGMCTHV